MAQDQEQHQTHAAGPHQHAEAGDSMQMLVVRLLLAASQTAEPVASELKDIAMTLSCATMAARDDCPSSGVKDEHSSTRDLGAVPSIVMLTDDASVPPHSRNGSQGGAITTSTELVLRDQAQPANAQNLLQARPAERPHLRTSGPPPPPRPQQTGLDQPSGARTYSGPREPQSGLQLDFGRRNFPSAGAKRSYPFEGANVPELKRQQNDFPAGPPGRRPVCRECFSAGLAVTCDHTARCNNCKTRSNVNCVYVACAQGTNCTAPQCHFMHPDQWSPHDRPVWQLKTAHLPAPPGAPVPESRPLPPASKPWRKNYGQQNKHRWGPQRQMPWTSGGTFGANPSFRSSMTGPMAPMPPQTSFTPMQNSVATPVNNKPFIFPKAEDIVVNFDFDERGGVSVTTPAGEFPRGVLKYENDE